MNTKPRTLSRSLNDRMIAGVIGGIAHRFGWSPTLLRVIYVLVSVASAAFPGILVYLILWLLIPNEGPIERLATTVAGLAARAAGAGRGLDHNTLAGLLGGLVGMLGGRDRAGAVPTVLSFLTGGHGVLAVRSPWGT